MTAIDPASRQEVLKLLHRIVDIGVDFKTSEEVYQRRPGPCELRDQLVRDLPEQAQSVEAVVRELLDTVLPASVNMASPRFQGFGDTGADTAAVAAAVVALFAQQNLINQSFCSPAATMTEIAVLRWFRDLLGYANPPVEQVRTVWDVGGIVTYGGTMSNAVAMLLARENAAPGTLEDGVAEPDRMGLVVPARIGHYSVKSSMAWAGCGTHLIEVPTRGLRYDPQALKRALVAHRGRVACVVAYAGDSRTQTVEDLRAVHDVVREVDEQVWLHVDACWGLMCALTPRLGHKLDGIALWDSVTVDAHKVLTIPYGMSALLVRRPEALRTVSSYSDLIMQEDFAFGQVTPFVGTKEWVSVRAWAMMRAHGRAGLAAMMDDRLERAAEFAEMVDASSRLLRLNEPDMAAVAFCYLPPGHDSERPDVAELNRVNRAIHARMMAEGRWHLHQFTIPDDTGRVLGGAMLSPLRFMSINPRITTRHMREVLAYVEELGAVA